MLNEPLQMGKLLNKDDKNLKETKDNDVEGELQGDEKKAPSAKKSLFMILELFSLGKINKLFNDNIIIILLLMIN